MVGRGWKSERDGEGERRMKETDSIKKIFKKINTPDRFLLRILSGMCDTALYEHSSAGNGLSTRSRSLFHALP